MSRIGVDIVELARFERLLRRHSGLVPQLFTVRERSYCEGSRMTGARYAARFCAKEATFKALGVDWLEGDVAWDEIEIRSDSNGAPHLLLTGGTQRRAAELGLSEPAVSLSHERGVAIAVVAFTGSAWSAGGAG